MKEGSPLLLPRRDLIIKSGALVVVFACGPESQPEPMPGPELPGIADLDFPLADDMYFIFGPHYKQRLPGVWYAIDVTTPDKNAKIVAAKRGKVTIASDYMVELALEGDPPNDGYSLEYVHVDNIQVEVEQIVRRGHELGKMTFNAPQGGKSDLQNLHLHFGIKRYGKPIRIDGVSIEGWIIREGKNPGEGTLSREDRYSWDNRTVAASFERNKNNLLIHPRFAQPGAKP